MHRSQLIISRSKRNKLQDSTLNTVDVLHNGLRRKISQTDYKSIYPRLKIGAKSQVNTISILKNQYDEADLYEEMIKMKEDNRQLSEENDQLKTAIRRENKINELFNKRKEDLPLHSMSLQKVMELKLILESEELQQTYSDCQAKLKHVLHKQKNDKNVMSHTGIEPEVQFYCVLEQLGADLEETKSQKTQKLEKMSLELHKLKASIRKLKQMSKAKVEELNELCQTIQKQKKTLPIKYDMNLSVTDSGLINRNKPIQEIEGEIVRLKMEQVTFEGQIQSKIDNFIKQKLLIYKQIDEMKEGIEIKCQLKSNNKLLSW